jgi:hypothetical protein
MLGLFSQGQQTEDFISVDKETYSLYSDGQWKELTIAARNAIRQGTDYFYLRLRTGIAYYMLGNYMKAEGQLKKALEFNTGDNTTIEYLYYSFLMQNKGHEALGMLHKAPHALRKRLTSLASPRPNNIHLDGGWFFSDQDKSIRDIDLDGEEDIYGEADIFNHAYYFSAGGRWFPKHWYSGYLAYTFLMLDKHKMAVSGDTVMADSQYNIYQHQVYHSSSFYPGYGINVTPALHFIQYRINTISPAYDSLTGEYSFPDTSIIKNNFIGFVGVKKDYSIITAGVFGAAANLNEHNQYQAGFELIAFPLGNLNLYLQGQFITHFNDSQLQPVFNILVGARPFHPVWLELSGTFGEVENYFEKNASAVYNFPDRIRFKYGLKILSTIAKRWQISLDYQCLGKKTDYLTYQQVDANGTTDYVPMLNPLNYIDHLIIGSLLWKL